MTYLEKINFSQVIPLLSISFVVLLLIYKLFYKIRSRYHISVNCWFCNGNTKVPFNDRNAWTCPNSVCQQYNGFNEEGDYNKEIVEQFDRSKNLSSCAGSSNYGDDKNYFRNEIIDSSNGFCNDCNENQRLKVEKLSQFEPKGENKYDQELTEYRRHLEELYRLCPTCEKQLGKVLREKKKMILGSKFLEFLAKGTDSLRRHPKVIMIKKLQYSKWKNITTFLILMLAIINFCMSVDNIITMLKKGLGREITDPLVRFILSGISYTIAIYNVVLSAISESFDISVFKKLFLFTKSLSLIFLHYFGIKLPNFVIDNNFVVTSCIPLSSIFLTFVRNIMDEFHVSRYTILLTIWSVHIGASNFEHDYSMETLKILMSAAALIFSFPSIYGKSSMNVTNNSFHKMYCEDLLMDDEDSMSLISNKTHSPNRSGNLFNMIYSSHIPNEFQNTGSTNYTIRPKNNLHSPISPFKRHINNKVLENRSFVPIHQSSRNFASDVHYNKSSPENASYGYDKNYLKSFAFNNENSYKSDDAWSTSSAFPPYNTNFMQSPRDVWTPNHFIEKNFVAEEGISVSPCNYSTTSFNRSSLLSPSRLGVNSINLEPGTQSWISGGFFNSQRENNFKNRNFSKYYQNQFNSYKEEQSRASSHSSGFESNSSCIQSTGLRYKGSKNFNTENDITKLNPFFQQDSVSNVLSSNSIYTSTSKVNLEKQPLQNAKTLHQLNDYLSTDNNNPDWRIQQRNKVGRNSLLGEKNSFNLNRLNEELTPIQRGSLLRKWKEQNCGL